MDKHYDVIIVGGRPAGSTLAARLGALRLRVLLLERATFPSLPAASSPIIYSPTLKMLDEIGADEAQYARGTPRIRRVIAHSKAYQVTVNIPMAHGRDYGYAIDRARFDAALWDNALRFPTVEGHQGVTVTDLLWEGDRVVGVLAQQGKGTPERITADLVVGADGRFSRVAQAVNAAVKDEYTALPTSLYYAYWRNIKPYDDLGPSAVAYEGGYGYGFLMMESADNTGVVTMEGQADLLDPAGGKVKEFYLDLVMGNPDIARRLDGAEMITNVRGMRRIGNRYRQPGGQGWALVGDAYHQHDPLDGQGIFNAVFSAKSLAWAIAYWKRHDKTWSGALRWYDQTVRMKTFGAYQAALNSVQMNLYGARDLPGWALTGMRWLAEDPSLHDLMGKMLTRQLPAELMLMLYPPLVAGAMVRGPLRDLRKRLPLIGG
jgi:flavin-dependent dehydrogenase